MYFARIKTPGIAHLAYIIADGGEAAIVDPRRDVGEYLTILREQGLDLRYVLETHRQEDFEVGAATLRRLTGAKIVAGTHRYFDHAQIRLEDGAELTLGSLTIRALHTPGHTPESVTYAVFLGDDGQRAWGVFTGDALFFGDTGRTDLTDAERTGENAGLLYNVLHEKVFPLGDQAQVFPAHGAGSACGGNVADRDHSTLGIERLTNAVATMEREEFVAHKVRERLARPPYFRLMEKVNLVAGRPMDDRPVPWLDPAGFAARCGTGVLIDTREPEAFAGGHLPGSYNVWLEGLGRYGGWIGSHEVPIWLVADSPTVVAEARLSLARIGRDHVAGALAGGFHAWRDAGLPIAITGTTTPDRLQAERAKAPVLDVREISEFEDEGHIPGARHLYVGELESRLDQLDLAKDEPVVVTCSVGQRASLAVSMLDRHGYKKLFNLLGGMTAWRRLGLPLERGPAGA